jgi:hypothetical protein
MLDNNNNYIDDEMMFNSSNMTKPLVIRHRKSPSVDGRFIRCQSAKALLTMAFLVMSASKTVASYHHASADMGK